MAGSDLRPLPLRGGGVRLEPLSPAHVPALGAVGRDPVIWEFMLEPAPVAEADLGAWVASALAAQATGSQVVWAIVAEPGNRVVGSTRCLDIRRGDRALEIGGTWLARGVWGSTVNAAAKLLLLAHTFEDLGAARVQLKTDARHVRSQRAIAALGAVREGVLRSYQRVWNGRHRDTVMFSIIAAERPAVRAWLAVRLAGAAR